VLIGIKKVRKGLFITLTVSFSDGHFLANGGWVQLSVSESEPVSTETQPCRVKKQSKLRVFSSILPPESP